MDRATIAGHLQKNKDMQARLAETSRRLVEAEGSAANRQALALINATAYDARDDLAEIAALRGEVAALQRAIELTAISLDAASASEKQRRISAAGAAFAQAVQARDADISRAMAAICAGLERLQAQGVPAPQFARWIAVQGPAYLHHTIVTEAMQDGIADLQRAQNELQAATGNGTSNAIGEVIQTALPIPQRSAIDEMAEAMLPLVITE